MGLIGEAMAESFCHPILSPSAPSLGVGFVPKGTWRDGS